MKNCTCGWALPRELNLNVNMQVHETLDDLAVVVSFRCPACGHPYLVEWTEAMRASTREPKLTLIPGGRHEGPSPNGEGDPA